MTTYCPEVETPLCKKEISNLVSLKYCVDCDRNWLKLTQGVIYQYIDKFGRSQTETCPECQAKKHLSDRTKILDALQQTKTELLSELGTVLAPVIESVSKQNEQILQKLKEIEDALKWHVPYPTTKPIDFPIQKWWPTRIGDNVEIQSPYWHCNTTNKKEDTQNENSSNDDQ